MVEASERSGRAQLLLRGGLVIDGNRELADVSALHDLVQVDGDVTVRGNPALGTSAADALVLEIDKITGTITVTGND